MKMTDQDAMLANRSKEVDKCAEACIDYSGDDVGEYLKLRLKLADAYVAYERATREWVEIQM